MNREAFEIVDVGDLVYVHDPVPPTYSLYLGQVEQKHLTPRVLVVYLPELGRTVYSEPDRIHGYPLGEGAGPETQPDCPYCRVPAVTGAAVPPPAESI